MKQEIIDLIKKHEGFRTKPYVCTGGKTTIGYGRNLDDNPISEKEGLYLLLSDFDKCKKDLRKIFPKWDLMKNNVKIVVFDMRYQLGGGGFRTFKKFIAEIKRDNINGAISEMKNSRWYKQTSERAEDLIRLLDV